MARRAVSSLSLRSAKARRSSSWLITCRARTVRVWV
jgi:hypothetical protein